METLEKPFVELATINKSLEKLHNNEHGVISHVIEPLHRFFEMGGIPGTEIKIFQSSRNGPVIIEIKNTRIAIGHILAKKIFVNIKND